MKRAYYPGLVASGLLALSAFLPWVDVDAFFMSISVTGIEGGDGWIIVALGLVAGLLFFIGSPWAFLPGVLAVGFGIYELTDISRGTSGMAEMESKGLSATIGSGIYLLFISSLGIVFMGLWLFRKKPTDDSAPLT